MKTSALNALKRNGWDSTHLLAAAVLTAVGCWVTYPAWEDIATIVEKDEESSHIMLVPIVFAWLLWVRRARLRLIHPTGQWAGPGIVAAGWALSHLGYHNAIQVFLHGGALLVVLGCLITAVGMDVVRRMIPAFLVLALLVPVPGMLRQKVAIPLQQYTAEVTHQIFLVIGMNVPRSGSVLYINGMEIGIAEACNGIRKVFALVLVSYAFAFGSPLRWYVRLTILVVSPVLAILTNVVRLIPTVWMYGYASLEVADTFHDIAGWGMLLVAFAMLYGIVHGLRWAMIPMTRYTLAYD